MQDIAYWWRRPEVSGGRRRRTAADADARSEVGFAFFTFRPRLSEADAELIDELNERAKSYRDLIRLVVDRKRNAFLIYGPGGHGKSTVVKEALAGVSNVVTTNTHLTPRGLFDLLKENQVHTHVLEDLEQTFKNHDCQSILRAACGGSPSDERWLSWEVEESRRPKRFMFEGGIIIVSNDPVDIWSGRGGAVASRFVPVKWELSREHLAAKMRDIAINCDDLEYDLTPEERLEAAEFVIEEMADDPVNVAADLRKLTEAALPIFEQWKLGKAEADWHDTVRTVIHGKPDKPRERDAEMKCRIAAEIDLGGGDTEHKISRWKERTGGLSKSQYYVWLDKAKKSGLYGIIEGMLDS